MADNLVPIPEGATIGEAQSQHATVPIPEGSTIGEAQGQAQQEVKADNRGILDKAGDFLGDVYGGAQSGLTETVAGATKLVNKIPGVHKVTKGTAFDIDEGVQQALDQQHAEDTASLGGKIGYGGETLLEFIMGDEALKGLSMADKLTKGAKIAKILESSPRIMQALKMGAGALKNPVVSSAIRQGIVGAAQEGIRSGGDLGQAAESGAGTAAAAALIGTPFEILKNVSAKGKLAKQTVDTLNDISKKAPTKEAMTDWLQDIVKKAESKLHSDYEAGINKLQKDVPNKMVYEDTPLYQKVQDLLGINRAKSAPMDEAFKGISAGGEQSKKVLNDLANLGKENPEGDWLYRVRDVGEEGVPEAATYPTGGLRPNMTRSLDEARKYVASRAATNGVPQEVVRIDLKKLAKDVGEDAVENLGRGPNGHDWFAAKGDIPEDYVNKVMHEIDVPELVKRRQQLGKAIREMPFGDPDARVYRQIIKGIDETITKLADTSGNPQAKGSYDALREGYANVYNKGFKSDAVRAIKAGKADEAIKQFLGGRSLNNLESLETAIGPEGMREFTKKAFGRLVDNATEGGNINPVKFINEIKKIPVETQEKLFYGYKNAPNAAPDMFKQFYKKVLSDAKTAANMQKLVRAGVFSGFNIGAAGLGAVGVGATGHIYGVLPALAAFAAEGGSISKLSDLIDHIANHPKMWSTIKLMSRAGEKLANERIPQVATGLASQSFAPDRRSTFNAAKDVLANGEE